MTVTMGKSMSGRSSDFRLPHDRMPATNTAAARRKVTEARRTASSVSRYTGTPRRLVDGRSPGCAHRVGGLRGADQAPGRPSESLRHRLPAAPGRSRRRPWARRPSRCAVAGRRGPATNASHGRSSSWPPSRPSNGRGRACRARPGGPRGGGGGGGARRGRRGRRGGEEGAVAGLIASADLVVLPGGDPDLISAILRDTLAWRAILAARARGAAAWGAGAGGPAPWSPPGASQRAIGVRAGEPLKLPG